MNSPVRFKLGNRRGKRLSTIRHSACSRLSISYQRQPKRRTQKANIKVCVRVRPANDRELCHPNGRDVIKILDRSVLVFDPADPSTLTAPIARHRPGITRRNKDLKLAFDCILDTNDRNQTVYDCTVNSILDKLIEGINCSVFAYGPTGAGKTHTMVGHPDEPGVATLAIADLYKRIDAIADDVRDLLNPQAGVLNIREDQNQGITMVANLSWHKPIGASDLMALLHEGNQRRTQHPTDANAESSRSHAVLQIVLTQRPRVDTELSTDVIVSKMCLIDLAGSERASATRNLGQRFREGANINKSLLALGNCINALAMGKRGAHVPYRDSRLTRILRDALGGNCQTVMIVNVSPSNLTYEDTYNTLKYADRAKQIRVDLSANVFRVDQHVHQYARIVDELRNENMRLKEKLQAALADNLKLRTEQDKLRTDLQRAYDINRTATAGVAIGASVMQPANTTFTHEREQQTLLKQNVIQQEVAPLARSLSPEPADPVCSNETQTLAAPQLMSNILPVVGGVDGYVDPRTMQLVSDIERVTANYTDVQRQLLRAQAQIHWEERRISERQLLRAQLTCLFWDEIKLKKVGQLINKVVIRFAIPTYYQRARRNQQATVHSDSVIERCRQRVEKHKQLLRTCSMELCKQKKSLCEVLVCAQQHNQTQQRSDSIASQLLRQCIDSVDVRLKAAQHDASVLYYDQLIHAQRNMYAFAQSLLSELLPLCHDQHLLLKSFDHMTNQLEQRLLNVTQTLQSLVGVRFQSDEGPNDVKSLSELPPVRMLPDLTRTDGSAWTELMVLAADHSISVAPGNSTYTLQQGLSPSLQQHQDGNRGISKWEPKRPPTPPPKTFTSEASVKSSPSLETPRASQFLRPTVSSSSRARFPSTDDLPTAASISTPVQHHGSILKRSNSSRPTVWSTSNKQRLLHNHPRPFTNKNNAIRRNILSAGKSKSSSHLLHKTTTTSASGDTKENVKPRFVV